MTLELNVFNICKQPNFDKEDVQDVHLIEKVCENDDIMSLWIFDPFKMALMTDTKFLNQFSFDDVIQVINYMDYAHGMYTAGWI